MYSNNAFENTPQDVLKTVAHYRQQPNTKIRWDVELSSGENAQENYFTLRVSIIIDEKTVPSLYSLHVQNLSKDFDKAVAKAKEFVQEGDLFTCEHGQSQSINRGSTFRFGKYIGKSFVDVANDDPSYFLYIRTWAKNSLFDSKRLQVNKQALLDDVEANKIADAVFQAKQKQDIENKEKRALQALNSNYVGNIDEAIEVEATVLHVKTGESDYGFWTKTKLIDDAGNIFIYWNDVFGSSTCIDAVSDYAPEEEHLRLANKYTFHGDGFKNHGQILSCSKGDRVKFKATVKDHFEDKFYFGAKTTKISRVRKLEIIFLALVDGYRANSTLNGNLKYHADNSKNFRFVNQKTKKEIPFRDFPKIDL